MDDLRNFQLERKLNDGNLDIFPGGIVNWRGPLDARFLILTDTPSHLDCLSNPKQLIDKDRELRKRFDSIFNLAFSNADRPKNRYAIASCCVGWDTKPYRKKPNAVELHASVGYLTDLIMAMPKLEMILSVGIFATELCCRNFDVHEMYGRPKHVELRTVDEPSWTMMSRKRFDKVEHCIVNNAKIVRYLQVATYSNKENNAFVTGTIVHIDRFAKHAPLLTELDVRTDERLGIPDSPRYLDFPRFKEKFHGMLRNLREKRLAAITDGSYDADKDDGVFIDASLDPYVLHRRNANEHHFLMNYQLQYDSPNNRMYMHCATPAGTPILVTVTDVIFTFWIRPNLAFANPGRLEDWCDIVKGVDLENRHLDHLRERIRQRLFYTVKERGAGNSSGTVFNLSVEKRKHDYMDGYMKDPSTEEEGRTGYAKNRFFDFIRCDVSNYNFIEVITALLNQMHKAHTKLYPRKLTHNASILECMQERHDVYEVFSAEQMFGNRYNIRTSYWHRVADMVIDEPAPLAAEEGVFHSKFLTSTIRMPLHHNPFEHLEPLKKVSLGYRDMTSFDMPKVVQTGFDIESGKFNKFYGSFWDSPVICMCAVSRRADDKIDKFKTPSFEAETGYKYFGFMLGTCSDVQNDDVDNELSGPEQLYEFAQESALFQSYFYFYSVQLARYWITHNGKGYDMPRVLSRAKVLGVDPGSLGYLPDQATRVTRRQFASRAYSEQTITSLEGECGITQIDTCEIFKRERKDKSNTLAFLSKLLINATKNDMPYEAIMGHWKESDDSRRTLLYYCHRDSQLPLQLVAHSKLIVAVNQLSRASGFISEGFISEKGMQEKVLGAFFKANYTLDMLYILRTNDYFSSRYNKEMLLSVRDLIDEYNALEEKEKTKDNKWEVASVNVLGKRAEEEGDRPKGNDEKRQRTIVRKDTRGSDVKPTALLDYFRSTTTSDSIIEAPSSLPPRPLPPPPSENKRIASKPSGRSKSRKQVASQRSSIATFFTSSKPLPKSDPEELTVGQWQDIAKKQYEHVKIVEDDNNGSSSSSSSSSTSTLDQSYFESVTSLKSSTLENLAPTVDLEDSFKTEVERRLHIEKEFSKAKASRNDTGNRDAEYQGAVVMKEKLGWRHDLPALCIDFASLYPSVKMTNNMGTNTKIYHDEMEERGVTMDMVHEPAKKQRVKNPRTGRKVRLFFLKKEVLAGVLAVAEFMLLGLRNEAKKLIDFYGNEFLDDGTTANPNYNKVLAAVALAASNNIKLLMNSMYGVCGTEGVLGDRHVAGSVTACGRESIMLAKKKTMKRYNAICAGGDTDSVFMQFPGLARGQLERRWAKACKKIEELERLEALGQAWPERLKVKFPALPDGWWRLKDMDDITRFAQEEWVPRINRNFAWPMKVDFEKAMYRFIAFAKKRYSFFYAFIGKTPYLTSKGLETVRRDSLPFVQKVLKELFNIIQVMPQKSPYSLEEDPDGSKADALDREFIKVLKNRAVDFIKEKARQLARGEVPISDLILSKQRSREYYTNQNQEHLTVVKKLEARGLEAPPVGNRIFFVYTHMKTEAKGKERKGYEIADDPECAVKENLPIDYMYYLDHKFKKSIIRTMRYFLYDEMVERVSKRKYDEYMYGVSNTRCAKRTKISVNADGSIPITMEEVNVETENYLFGTAQTGNVNARNMQTRYLNLTGGRVRQAYIDKNDKSSINTYMQKSETRFEELKRRTKTDDHRVILEAETQKLLDSGAAYAQCLKTCRSCLHIPESKPVQCVAHDCLQYLPRISSQRDHLQNTANLEELCTDIESLFT